MVVLSKFSVTLYAVVVDHEKEIRGGSRQAATLLCYVIKDVGP